MTGHRCHFDLKSNNTFPIETLEFLPFFFISFYGRQSFETAIKAKEKKNWHPELSGQVNQMTARNQ